MSLSIVASIAYSAFERCVEMPTKGSKLDNWRKTQLGNQPYGLDARIPCGRIGKLSSRDALRKKKVSTVYFA